MVSLAHIINPFVAEPASELRFAQPITLETMRRACRFPAGSVAVELFAIQCQDEERVPLPDCFTRLPDLTRSVADVRSFKKRRNLPLIKDILDALSAAAGGADYFIYTNVDIALQPHFYASVASFIEGGTAGFVINRRTIPGHYSTVDDLPLMYAEIGESHPGYDCFVFRRDSYPRFKLGTVCIGSAGIGRALLANLVAYGGRFREIRDAHLTFHIGDACSWRSQEFSDYLRENWNEYVSLYGQIEAERGGFDPLVRSYLLDKGEKRFIPDFASQSIAGGAFLPQERP